MNEDVLDTAADRLEQTASSFAAQGGLKAKLAQPLAADADLLRKLKPSLIVARAKGEAPTNEQPSEGRLAPAAPQLGRRPRPRNGGGPSPWLVIGVAVAVGIALAKIVDWRGHAHPRD